MSNILETINQSRIVAIVRGVTPKEMKRTIAALVDGNIRCIEVTFNQKNKQTINETIDSLKLIKKEFQNKVYLGAGTVINKEQVKMAVDAGAEYIISPNTDLEVIKYTKELGKISIPGAFTPSEAVTAYNAGADIVKLFPAGILGIKYIKAFLAPLSHIPVVAVGGVNISNIDEFIKAGAQGVGIGGNLVNLEAIKAGEYEKLTQVAKLYTQKIKELQNV